jgi:hypothetical protein
MSSEQETHKQHIKKSLKRAMPSFVDNFVHRTLCFFLRLSNFSGATSFWIEYSISKDFDIPNFRIMSCKIKRKPDNKLNLCFVHMHVTDSAKRKKPIRYHIYDQFIYLRYILEEFPIEVFSYQHEVYPTFMPTKQG